MTKAQLRAIISNNVREKRIAAHMNQTELAEACNTTQARISLIEGAKAPVDDELLALFGEIFHVHPATLMMDAGETAKKRNLKVSA